MAEATLTGLSWDKMVILTTSDPNTIMTDDANTITMTDVNTITMQGD